MEGYIVFGADPIGIGFFVSVHYILNQLMDFDQTCMDTLLGGGEELIRLDYDDLVLIFKVTRAL